MVDHAHDRLEHIDHETGFESLWEDFRVTVIVIMIVRACGGSAGVGELVSVLFIKALTCNGRGWGVWVSRRCRCIMGDEDMRGVGRVRSV